MYLEELITCVHIIQLKILTSMRVGQKQKKIDINIPKFDDFIHKVYINTARKIYKNIYLFELNIPPLHAQKNNREIEIIVQECILNTIRESIPVEAILKAYMDESVEEDIVEEIKEQLIEEQIVEEKVKENNQTNDNNSNNNLSFTTNGGGSSSQLSFNDIDYIKDDNNNIISVTAPKTIERLEEISELRAQQRKQDEDDEDEDNGRLKISDEHIELGALDIHNIEEPKMDLLPDLLIDDIEILD
jgi:hypothetical protein